MSDLKQQLEAVRDRMADDFQDNDTSEEMWKDSLSYKAGFNAAIPIILKAVEQRDSLRIDDYGDIYNQELLKKFTDGGR